MSHLSEIVDSLEIRINKLLHQHENLKLQNQALTGELEGLKSQQEQFGSEREEWRDKCNALKVAKSMLGSDQHKRETKLKINALVREIDQCISQLSE